MLVIIGESEEVQEEGEKEGRRGMRRREGEEGREGSDIPHSGVLHIVLLDVGNSCIDL